MITRKTFEDSFEMESEDLAADANVREVKDSVRMEFDDWLAVNPDVYIAHFSEHSETVPSEILTTHGNHIRANTRLFTCHDTQYTDKFKKRSQEKF